jgi:hypothetical protein
MGVAMKYMVTWNERPMGSAEAYEAAQKRILGVFSQWKMPDNLKVHQFLVRVGEYGGFMCLETDDDRPPSMGPAIMLVD